MKLRFLFLLVLIFALMMGLANVGFAEKKNHGDLDLHQQ